MGSLVKEHSVALHYCTGVKGRAQRASVRLRKGSGWRGCVGSRPLGRGAEVSMERCWCSGVEPRTHSDTCVSPEAEIGSGDKGVNVSIHIVTCVNRTIPRNLPIEIWMPTTLPTA